ncbi:hypothetical protein M513_14044, partial [Trichuris suis]
CIIIDVEECSLQPIPCEPHGKCIDTFGSYLCHCFPGWTGKKCNDDFNECTSGEQVCFNGGTCTNTVGSYSCACTERWTGPTCRERKYVSMHSLILLCSDAVVLMNDNLFSSQTALGVFHFGDSLVYVNDTSSICFVSTEWSYCFSNRICVLFYPPSADLCNQLECVNGLCVQKEDGFHVEYRDECEEKKDLCSKNGVCSDRSGNYTCTCHVGYTGKNCEK